MFRRAQRARRARERAAAWRRFCSFLFFSFFSFFLFLFSSFFLLPFFSSPFYYLVVKLWCGIGGKMAPIFLSLVLYWGSRKQPQQSSLSSSQRAVRHGSCVLPRVFFARAAARAAREKEKEEREKKREGKKKERQKEEGRNPTLGFFFDFLRFLKIWHIISGRVFETVFQNSGHRRISTCIPELEIQWETFLYNLGVLCSVMTNAR